jgi:class 3 adenylate cyclase/tetratricopeptide (TPR) repeat protein
VRCAACQFDNPAGMRFCVQCGASLAARCPQCGAEVAAGFRFCGHCGAGLAPAAAAPAPASGGERVRVAYTPKHLAEKILKGRSALEGERRQVTVLFADVAGFTTLAEKLDPEEVHGIIERCFEAITAEVHRLEGTINQYTGDGVMALFGAPIAHEDSPRRAVHAALGIQRALRTLSADLQREGGLAIEMRIGINTGPVVVGKIGDDLRMDYTAVGDTTNLAARLQQTARPGSIRVSEATHRLIGGFFETLDLGELPVKGHAPVHAFEILRARGGRARLDVAVERGLTPLVARGRELETLVGLFHEVKAGRGQVVSIVGEAGVGKSRLLYELRRQLAAGGEDATWLEGRCVSFGQSIPFLPLIDQLRENFGVQELDGEPEIIAKIEHGMRRMGELEPHIPYIRYLLSVDPGEPAVTAMDPAARRKKALDAVRALSLRGARLRPIVFVFEDLHWIDTSSEEHIGLLVDSLAGAPIMLVLTYRTGYAPRFSARSFHTTVNVGSLSETDTLALAGRVLGVEGFPAELRAALMEKAGGIPLFVEELTKTLLDLGIIRREGDGYRMVKRLDEAGVPDTIQEIIMARLDRLGEGGKRTVQLASVIGRQFLHRLLERIAGMAGELEGLLRELKSLEIIYEQGLLAEPAYIFKHAVIQDVAYNSLLVQRRRELHRAVGAALEELFPDRLAEHYGELAHHFSQAEEWDKALEYSDLAARRAADSFANAEARDHYARAVEAADRRRPALPPARLADLYTRSGAVLMTLGEYEPSVAAYERAAELARAAGDRTLETESLMGLGATYNFYHQPDRALEVLDRSLAVAREVGDGPLQAASLAAIVITRTAGFGQIRESTEQAEEALRLAPAIADPRLHAQVLIYAGVSLQWRSQFARAREVLERGVALARAAHSGFNEGLATFHIGNLLLSQGQYEEALATYRRLYEYALAAGDRFALVRAANSIGGVHLDLFDLGETARISLEADELTQKVFPWPEPRAHSFLKLAFAYLGGGDHGLAGEYLDRAAALLDVDIWGRWRWHMPLLRARGELALARGDFDEAWRCAAESAERAAHTDSQKHLASAQRLQGEILVARDRLDEALVPLTAAVTLAERLGTRRELWAASAALGALCARLGRDADAQRHWETAAGTLDAIARELTTPSLQQSFAAAAPVVAVYRALGRRPPAPGV